MRKIIISTLVLVGSMVPAACGGSGTKTVTVARTVTASSSTTASTASSSTTTTTAPQPKPTDCDALGINAIQMHEGACSLNGTTKVFVVNKGHTAHLKGMDVSLQSITTRDSVSDSSGMSATANGKFGIATISVTNKLNSSQSWQNGQAGLLVATGSKSNPKTYDEDFNAENGADQKSCLWKMGGVNGGLQAGESMTCDVVFDIPTNLSPESHGSTVVVDRFGESDFSNPTGRIAILRTYR